METIKMTASAAANDENFVKNDISVFVKIETNHLFAIGTAV